MVQKTNKNPIAELLINIILPTLILNKGGGYFKDMFPGFEYASKMALVVAISLPAIWGIYDLVKNKNKNFISLLGFVSILVTGGLGIMELEGHWFAIKEAAFPLVIGLVVLISAYTAKPLVRLMIYNETFLDIKKVQKALIERSSTASFEKHLRLSTIFFAFSFFVSAILNYILAVSIFTEIPLDLPQIQREEILNQQIADMTWRGYVVILVPSLIIFAAILWHLFNGIKKYTGYSFNDIVIDQSPQKQSGEQ